MMSMKGYTSDIPDNCARARLEGVNASYKDLAQVCGSIRSKRSDWAISFLEKAAEGEAAVYFKGHNKRLAHRRELGGRKGRYPKKAARIVLKLLKSAIANGRTLGLGESYTVLAANANKKHIYPRIAAKGRWARANLETSRVEIILQGSEVPKGVEVTPPAKKEKPPAKPEPKKTAEKKAEPKKEAPSGKKEEAKAEKPPAEPEAEPEPKKAEEPPKEDLKGEAKAHHQHKHEGEGSKKEEKPHQHGEHSKR